MKKDNEIINKCTGQCCSCQSLCTKDVPFLKGLPIEKQMRIADSALHKTYLKDELLFKEGDKVDGLFIIHTGAIKLTTYDSEGNEKIVGIYSAGETLWEEVFSANEEYKYNAVAIEEAKVCKLLKKEFKKEISTLDIAFDIIEMLSNNLSEAKEMNELLTTSTGISRVAGFLIYMARKTKNNIVTLKLDNIAASLNMRPETVSRKIKELSLENVVEKTGQSSIKIRNFEKLKEIFEK